MVPYETGCSGADMRLSVTRAPAAKSSRADTWNRSLVIRMSLRKVQNLHDVATDRDGEKDIEDSCAKANKR